MSAHATADLLDTTAAFLRRFVVLGAPEVADATALWVGHSWLYDQFDTTPYLAIQSPQKGSGKTRLLECLRLVTREPVPIAGASLAALFRLIDERHPTLLLDEADTIFGSRQADRTEDLRGLLNNGYRRGVPFWRVVGEGRKMRVESFDVFCPKAIACIGRLPDTVQDRSIVLALKRRAPHEPVERFRFRNAELDGSPIREAWNAIASELELPAEADVPDELPDRAADSWEPLLALADAAGEGWPTRGRRAALHLSGACEVDDDRVAVLLLADIRDTFAEEQSERLTLKLLLERLLSVAFEEHPWQEWNNGRGLRPTGLGRLLRPFGIRARQLRNGGANVRGYDLEQFTDAFSRYLPPPPDSASYRYTAAFEHDGKRPDSGVAVQTTSSGVGARSGDGPVDSSAIRDISQVVTSVVALPGPPCEPIA
jgi:hypothetical protein